MRGRMFTSMPVLCPLNARSHSPVRDHQSHQHTWPNVPCAGGVDLHLGGWGSKEADLKERDHEEGELEWLEFFGKEGKHIDNTGSELVT